MKAKDTKETAPADNAPESMETTAGTRSEHDYRRPLASDARRAIDYFTGKEETRKWIAETGESTPVHYVRTRVVSLVDALSP